MNAQLSTGTENSRTGIFHYAPHYRVVERVENSCDDYYYAYERKLQVGQCFGKKYERKKIVYKKVVSEISSESAERKAPEITFVIKLIRFR